MKEMALRGGIVGSGDVGLAVAPLGIRTLRQAAMHRGWAGTSRGRNAPTTDHRPPTTEECADHLVLAINLH